MLGIVLLILKIIGLLLLGILGLFLTLVILVLFVPIPYHVWVKGDSGKLEELSYWVKIFGFQVFPKKERKKRRRKQQREEKPPEIPQAETEGTTCTGQEPDHGRPPAEPQTQGTPQAESQTETAKQKAQKQGKKRLKSSKSKEKNTAGRDVRSMLKQLHTEITDEGNRRALKYVLSEIRYLLRHIGPRRVRADLSFSLGDPANTGYATAALSVCPFSYGKDCHIIPDFDTEQLYVRGWLDVRGHVRIIHVLISVLRLLFDKDIRRIISKIRKKK